MTTNSRSLESEGGRSLPLWGGLARIRAVWAFFLAAAMQRLPFALLQPESLVELKKMLLVSSHLLLAWALCRNLSLRSVRVILLGSLMNLAAIVANGGLMPVSLEARALAGMTDLGNAWLGRVLPEGTGILLSVEQTRLWILTDIIPLDLVGGVFSIGDVLLGIGLVLFFIEVLWTPQAEFVHAGVTGALAKAFDRRWTPRRALRTRREGKSR